MVPLMYTIAGVCSNIDDSYELTEGFGEEENSDDRESEEDTELDEVEFDVQHNVDVALQNIVDIEFHLRNLKINKRHTDVLVPPPELV